MSNHLQQARIEAAARAIYDEWRSPDYFTWEQAVEGRNANPDPTFPHIVDRFRGQARAALAAADAHLPSVEQIAEEIAGHPILSGFYQTTVGVGEAREMAEAIRALFGEVAGDE